MTDFDFPVLIIGGGPVGLSTALELEHHGIRCGIVEPRTTVTHSRPRAKTTSARTMELFRRWGLADAIRAAAPLSPDWSDRVTFADTVIGPEITHVAGCLGLSTPPWISPERGQQVSQGVVEETLRAAIAERRGIEPLWGWRAAEVEQYDDHASVTVSKPDGATMTLTAEWIIGADGPRSIVRGAMGARYEGSAGGRPNVNITFRSRELAGRIPHPPSIHYWAINPESPGVVGPLDLDGTWWAIATGTEDVDSDTHAADIVRGLVGADIDVEVIATDPWQARMLLANRYRTDRLFLVGDAAHQNPPWGGHGFNTGVNDAVNLGWKLAAVIKGWAPAELLDTYESDRRPIAAQTIRVASRNMATLSNDLAEPTDDTEEVAARIRREKSREFHADGLVFGYGYGPAMDDDADPGVFAPSIRPGLRLPHRMHDGSPLQDLLGRGLTFIGPPAMAVPFQNTAAAARVPLQAIHADDTPILVRPDQHIAWVGEEENPVINPAAVLATAVRGGFVG